MADTRGHTLPKAERLSSRKTIERMFGGGSKSVSAFPMRAVFTPSEGNVSDIMVSVSKRLFKRAVKRNRVKRQIREAYRLNKHILDAAATPFHIAFLWNDSKEADSGTVAEKTRLLLYRITETFPPRKHDEESV